MRYQGGVKSDILTDVAKGTEVTVLEEMENWSKVKAEGAFIGYVENKRLSEQTTVEPVPVTDYVEPVYTSNSLYCSAAPIRPSIRCCLVLKPASTS